MDPVDAKEKYFKAMETIRELKKQNNSLQEVNKKLLTRMRWPEHVRIAVQNKEMSENQKVIEKRLLELSKQCNAYEQEIMNLKAQRDKERMTDNKVTLETVPIHEVNCKTLNEQTTIVHTTLERKLQEMQKKEASYKQQIEETKERLQQTEDRLAQILRLRTMDSAELFRLSRANKVMAAEVTALQDDNHRLTNTADDARTKMDELVEQLNHEQQRCTELQEEVAQFQLTQRSMLDLNKELEEAKKECEMLRNHIKSTLAEAAKSTETAAKDSSNEEAMSFKLAEMQKSVNEQTASLQHLSLQLDEQKRLEKERTEVQQNLVAENNQLKKMLMKQAVTSPGLVQVKAVTKEQGVQTMNMGEKLKLPEVACALNPEESDLILAQLHRKIESQRELARTQTNLAKIFKEEMESLREQLKSEREQYASELTEKMTRIQEMQLLLNQQCVLDERNHNPPIPAPRHSLSQHKSKKENNLTLQALEVNIQSLSATDNSPLLGAKDSSGRLFIEFVLLPTSDEPSQETPGNFLRPSAPNEPVAINHTHCWKTKEQIGLSTTSYLHFSVIGEPDQDCDLEEDCTEFGTAEILLEDLWESLCNQGPDTMINIDVPVINEEKLTLGHLHIAIRCPVL